MSDISLDIVTSTDFIEYNDNVYAAVIENRHYRLEHSINEKNIRISMSFLELSAAARDDLLRSLLSALSIREEQITFSPHSFSIQIFLESDWTAKLKTIMNLLTAWAKSRNIISGCFLCGNDDSSVLFQECNGKETYLCESCKSFAEEDMQIKCQEEERVEFLKTKRENFSYGIPFTLGARIILSILWIPFASSLCKEALLTRYAGGDFLNMLAASFFFAFIGTAICLHVYRKAAGYISLWGYGIVSIIFFFSSMIETAFILLLASEAAFGTVSLVFASNPVEFIYLVDLRLSRIISNITETLLYVTPAIGMACGMILTRVANNFYTDFYGSIKKDSY